MDRVTRTRRVGNVALNALERELAGEAAATAVLDHVAQTMDRGGLAHDAPVQTLAAGLERLAHDPGCLLYTSSSPRD